MEAVIVPQPGTQVSSRLNRVQIALDRYKARALFLAPGDDMRYLIGYTPLVDERLTLLAVGQYGAALVVPSVNVTQARERLRGTPIDIVEFSDVRGPRTGLAHALKVAGGSVGGGILLISDEARYDHARLLQEALNPDRLEPASHIMRSLRLIKDADEIRRLKAAARLTDQAMTAGLSALRAGVAEWDVRDAIYRAFMRGGAEEASFILVAHGPNSAEPHHEAGPSTIGTGPVTLDIGCRYQGYASDITRVAFVGKPDPEFLKIYAVVRAARVAGEAAARLDSPAADVDRAARAVIEKAGYGAYFVHRTGHGIGVSTHEPPWMMEGDNTPLAPGMAFSIEPGVYLPGRFGVRLEDVAVMTGSGPEILSSLPHAIMQV